jgi:RNA polymerase sigma-70 factor (ECF subfamily)
VPDRSLVEAVTAGDRDAFHRVVESESPNVFRTCFRILGTVQEAEDAAQETFVIAYRAIDTFRGDGPIGAWLARIAARQSFRRLAQRRTVESLDLAVEPIARAGDVDGDPLGRALAAEREAAVRLAVAALPDPYREVVALRFFGELSLAEIAAATERPLGTVKTHLRRGLGRLRDALGEEVAA